MARRLPWQHYSVGTHTREEAIEEMRTLYDAHPGNRRKPSREAFEIYRARHVRGVGWILYVREVGRERAGEA